MQEGVGQLRFVALDGERAAVDGQDAFTRTCFIIGRPFSKPAEFDGVVERQRIVEPIRQDSPTQCDVPRQTLSRKGSMKFMLKYTTCAPSTDLQVLDSGAVSDAPLVFNQDAKRLVGPDLHRHLQLGPRPSENTHKFLSKSESNWSFLHVPLFIDETPHQCDKFLRFQSILVDGSIALNQNATFGRIFFPPRIQERNSNGTTFSILMVVELILLDRCKCTPDPLVVSVPTWPDQRTVPGCWCNRGRSRGLASALQTWADSWNAVSAGTCPCWGGPTGRPRDASGLGRRPPSGPEPERAIIPCRRTEISKWEREQQINTTQSIVFTKPRSEDPTSSSLWPNYYAISNWYR